MGEFAEKSSYIQFFERMSINDVQHLLESSNEQLFIFYVYVQSHFFEGINQSLRIFINKVNDKILQQIFVIGRHFGYCPQVDKCNFAGWRDKDISWMWVCMEETMLQHLRQI